MTALKRLGCANVRQQHFPRAADHRSRQPHAGLPEYARRLVLPARTATHARPSPAGGCAQQSATAYRTAHRREHSDRCPRHRPPTRFLLDARSAKPKKAVLALLFEWRCTPVPFDRRGDRSRSRAAARAARSHDRPSTAPVVPASSGRWARRRPAGQRAARQLGAKFSLPRQACG